MAHAGFFGQRMADMARRYGADVVEVKADWGQAVPNERIVEELDANPDARLVTVVHAETSTGVQHPLAELAAEVRERDTLLMADCVTSLGSVELDVGGWGVDFAYSCTQKGLAAPPGMSPLAVSDAALDRIRARKTPVPFSFDLFALEQYWIERPVVYHHTAPILHIYALHQALYNLLDEGPEQRRERHEQAAAHLRGRLDERGLELLADPGRQLAALTAVRVPDGVNGKAVQGRLLDEFKIEVGGGLGPAAPPMWRIGLMGPNATVETADTVFGALDTALADAPAPAAAAAR